MPAHKIFRFLGALALLAVCAYVDGNGWFVFIVSAAGGGTFPAGMEQTIADLVGKVIVVMDVITWILFTFLNYLLDPLFVFGVGGNLMTILNEIWQLARNLMNIIFAFALLAAAIYTIFTAKKEFLSQYGSKFVLAVILVNFSWFLPRVALDVAHVGAAAVYGIPSLLNNNPGAQCWVTRQVPPAIPAGFQCQVQNGQTRCRCMGVVDVKFFLTDAQRRFVEAAGYTCPLGTVLCYKQQVLNFDDTAPYSAVLNGLVINHARLAQLANVPSAPLASSAPMKMVAYLIKVAIVLIIHIALLFPLLAMTIAFFIRIPVLWVTIAFMPFYFLDFLLGGSGEQLTQGYGKKILSTFLKAAFLPMIVGVPLSIGLLLLNAGTQLTGGTAVNISIPLFNDIGNIWQLLWLCMALAVLWVGVFAVLKGDDILSTGAQSIKGYGEALGKIALKAPLAVPTIPGTNMSVLGGLRNLHPRNIDHALSSGQPLNKDFFSKLLNQPTASKEQREAAQKINKDSALQGALIKNIEATNNGSQSIKQLVEYLNKNFTGLNATSSNLHSVLQGLRQGGATAITASHLSGIQDRINKGDKEEEAKKKGAGAP